MLLGAPAFLFKQFCCLVGSKFSLCVVWLSNSGASRILGLSYNPKPCTPFS